MPELRNFRPKAMDGRSFISYSAQDAGLASAVYAFLKSNGHDAVKAPEDIALGEDWAAAIATLIEHSDFFILLWTHNSMSSKEVAKELTLAMNCGSKIIPFRAEDLSPEGAWRYHLMNVQWLEAHAMPEAAALEALLTYFKRSEKDKMDYKSSDTKCPLPEHISTNIHGHNKELNKETLKQEDSLAVDYTAAACIRDTDIEEEGNQLRAVDPNVSESHPSSSPALENLDYAEEAESTINNFQASWQFSAAVEIARTWGHSAEAASEAHSKRTLLGYRLCNERGITIALIPLAMIDSRRPLTPSLGIDISDGNGSASNNLHGRPTAISLFSTVLDIAKRMGYVNLEAACESQSHRGIFNFVIRDDERQVLARIPLSMINSVKL